MTNESGSLLHGQRATLVVAVLSLVMVLVAMAGDPVLNRDGMYYVDSARAMLASDASADHQWLFFPAMLAFPAELLSLDPVVIASVYSVLTSVLLSVFLFVWLSRLQPVAHPYIAALLALAVPWVPEYQTYVIRDSAAWLAVVATLWLARLWVLEHRWRWLCLMPLVALAGFLFRTEMLSLLVVPGWLLLVAAWRRGWQMLLAVVIAVVAAAGMAFLLAGELVLSHIRFYLDTVASKPQLMLMPEFIDYLETQVNPYARSDLGTVLTAGFLLLPAIGLVSALGIFVLPVLFALRRQATAPLRLDDGASMVMLLVFLAVVLAFLFVMQFMAGRYLVPLAICLMPWLQQGMMRMVNDFPRLSRGFVAVAVLMTITSSVSFSEGKAYLREAGEYVLQHRDQLGEVYYTDARVAFYAGDRYRPKQQLPLPVADMNKVTAAQSLVLVVDRDTPGLPAFLEGLGKTHGFDTIVFDADDGDDKGVLILTR